MATITLPKTWVTGDTLTAADLNNEFTTISNDYNGNITPANFSAILTFLATNFLDLSAIATTTTTLGLRLPTGTAGTAAGQLSYDASAKTLRLGDGTTANQLLQSARVIRTAGDYTTTSTSFVDVDTTNVAITLTTGANPVLIGFTGTSYNSGTATGRFDVTIDGTRQGGSAEGLTAMASSGASANQNVSFVYRSAALTAASHTFRLQWYVGAGTQTVEANTTTAPLVFWVLELK